jgi:hypothetical protein
LLKIFENREIIFIIINRNADNYLLFLSSRHLKGRPKINKRGKEGEWDKKENKKIDRKKKEKGRSEK